MLTDPIADMLARIRNAAMVHHKSVSMPASKLKLRILEVLKQAGYIEDFQEVADGTRQNVTVFLRYDNKSKESAIMGIERVSRPGRRVYVNKGDIPKVLSGLGVSVLSTSKGILADRQARAEGVGGEVLLKVW
jgi:small subunit ribosomal protein S8